MALLRQFSGDDTLTYYDENGNPVRSGVSNRNLDLNAYPGDLYSGSSSQSNQYEAVLQMADKLISQANQSTAAQNQLQLQMAREANAMTARQAELSRQFNASEALKAFERSEQSRLATQQYNTAERIAAQNYNSAEAQKQMDFQERMSNTQYQRAVADLYAAGLNPLLAVGASAGNVSGSSGSVSGSRSSASSSHAASSSSGTYHSAQAYKTNVESIINGVLSYAVGMRSAELTEQKNVLGFIGQLVSAIF